MYIGVVNWWVGPSGRPDNKILGRVHFMRAAVPLMQLYYLVD